MTTWSQGGTDPASAWDDCGPAPSSSWRFCDAPALDSIDPDSGIQGESVAVTLRGAGFDAISSVQVSGAGVTVEDVVVVDSQTITATLVIGLAAAIGNRSVTVVTAAGTSNAVTFAISVAVPAAPSNVLATALTITTVNVTWDDVADADTYEIERDGVVIATGILPAVELYADAGLAANTTYTYRVRARNAAGPSDWSAASITSTPWTLIPNRALWLEGDADADITVATGVSAWTDHSGNGRTVVQATGSKQPAKTAGAMNGRQAIRFDGLSHLLTWLVDVQLNAGSTFVLAFAPRFANTTAYRPLVRIANSNASALQHQASNDGGGPTVQSKLEGFVVGSGGLKRATPAAVTTQGERCMTVIVDPTAGTISLWHNGVLVGGPSSGVVGITTSIGDTLRLCADETGVNFGQYDLGTVRLFTRALSATERAAVESEAMARWVP